MGYFKFATAGSVDDGKSTLIGRLLYDLKVLKTDQIEALHQDGELNLAFATDGLQAEREKGITIDVAYRFFDIEEKRFVCVDAPGHYQYLSKAFTAFTQVGAVLLLVDVNDTLKPQFFMHLKMVAMLQIQHIAVLINKMDLVQYEQNAFAILKDEIDSFAFENKLNIEIIPISALQGDNVVVKSGLMSWYEGKTVYEWLQMTSNEVVKAPLSIIITEDAQKGYYTFEGNKRDLLKLNLQENDLVNGKKSEHLALETKEEEELISYNLYIENASTWLESADVHAVYYYDNILLKWMLLPKVKTINLEGIVLNEEIFNELITQNESFWLQTHLGLLSISKENFSIQKEGLLLKGSLYLTEGERFLPYALHRSFGKALLLNKEQEPLAAIMIKTVE